MRKPAVLLFLLLSASALVAQPSPNIERGVMPGKSYQSGEVDTINLFNGTVNVSIPIGGAYSVGGTLSYGFNLVYATNTWSQGAHGVTTYVPPSYEYHEYSYMYPAEHSNGGFGWILTLGKIVTNDAGNKAYLSPDGGQHVFYNTLHYNRFGEASSGVSYTRDGTYLRLHTYADRYELDFPNGNVHTFSTAGELQSMRDQAGNSVTVTYTTDPATGWPKWVVSDSTGRQHSVFFRPSYTYAEAGFDYPVAHNVIDHIEVAGFSGPSTYTFNYSVLPGQTATTNEQLSRRCTTGWDPATPQYIVVPMLTSISMPLGLTYGMQYDMGDHVNCSNARLGGYSGNLTSLTLPTGAKVAYQYGVYAFPSSATDRRVVYAHTAGVQSRKVYDSDGQTLLSDTAYEPVRQDPLPSPGQEYYQVRRVSHNDGGRVVSRSDHYFNVCVASSGCDQREYGLPIKKDGTAPYLSTEIRTYDANGNGTVQRSTYVTYDADVVFTGPSNEGTDYNRRVKATKTVFEDSTWSSVSSSNFDGLGHYRQTDTDGNFLSGNVRTSFTNFNPNAFTYDPAGNDSFVMPSSWILGTSTYSTSSEGSTSKVYTCFNGLGQLIARRVPTSASGLSTTDLVTTYTYSAGNVTSEKFYGGDTGPAVSATNECTATTAAPAYRIDHSYDSGSLKASWYVDGSGNPLPFFIVDNAINANTGAVASTYTGSSGAGGASNHDGLVTQFTYDALGRLTNVTHPAAGVTRDADTTYTYVANPPSVTVAQKVGATTYSTSTSTFDGLGRLKRETRSMPSGVTSHRDTAWNQLGWRTAVSSWGDQTTLSQTTFAYDAFGRVTTVTQPDGHVATTSYTGPRSVQRMVKVRTGGDAVTLTETNAYTTEEYDRQGRLWRITEPNGVVTQYGYDSAGRTTSVCANVVNGVCGQQRAFVYDNRGFLTSETHPEKGTTQYPSYDARGHVRRRYDGSANGKFDLTFTFDQAERLTTVAETGGSMRVLKSFDFAASGLSRGRLSRATRHNYFPAFAMDIQVLEDYVYAERETRVSGRTTYEVECSTTCTTQRTFSQTFGYDPLGNSSSVGYPTCAGDCSSASVSRTVTNTYDQGLLTSVQWSGGPAASTITYHPTGMVNVVTHGNGVTDTHTPETTSQGLPTERLGAISVKSYTDTAACVAPTFTQQPQSATIASGAPATLTATASGDTGSTISYQWYQGATLIGTTQSVTVTPLTTTTYYAKATNTCGTATSVTITITVCTPPSLASTPANRTITRGQTVVLSGSTSAPAPLQWYTVTNGVATAIAGQTSDLLPVNPNQTTTYRLVAKNDCGSVSADAVVTVLDPPTAPTLVGVTTDGTLNTIQWTAASSAAGIASYVIERVTDGYTLTFPANALSQTVSVPSTRTWIYRVRARDNNGIYGPYSGTDMTTTMAFTDATLTARVTFVRGIHIGELRRAIDYMREAAGLPDAWTSYTAATGSITAAALSEMRNKLNEARRLLFLPEIMFTDSTVTPRQTLIRVEHIRELRDGTR